ncbi:MAG TPA: GAF domain-containing sensor histidine kinase [Solirubrobacteraceae bacterium]|jgi:signal transduction histidine kinase|nr:GAF domain-containing sensor histidine kinase [Solirubrobacteraceae bacterium]
MAESLSPALKAVSDAVLAVASELSVDDVLQRLVDTARELASARYAALGIPDGSGGFRRFLVAGMSDELIEAMGPLPRTHGMLGAMLETSGAYRTQDIHDDPRFRGWWPRRHPDMRSFLGVPIRARDEVIGAFYLTEKEGADAFDELDQELIELLAAHAAIAITNARLYERSRELSILSERNRLALELHDVVSQKLFSLNLSADAAATLLDRDADAARAQLGRVRELAREALAELRSLILGLRPADLDQDGLAGALGKEVAMLARVHGIDIELEVECTDRPIEDGERELEVLRIAHEALHNAVRHAAARHVVVHLDGRGPVLKVEVVDDGEGFDPDDPDLRSHHLGLTSMEERTRELGGTLELQSTLGQGTRVSLEVPRE